MEIALAVFSWIVTILGPLLLLSVPVDLVVRLAKKDWKGSKAQKVYRTVQLVCLGVCVLSLMIAIVLMGVPL